MNCEHCRSLLLDHLYGLLDSAEAAELDAHLASCPACAAAGAETARVQGLIARAAKSAFPATKFEPPAPPQPVPAFPAPAGKGQGRSRRVATVLPWVIAASVLVAIPGTVLPVLGLFRSADRAGHEAEVAQLDAQSAARTAEVAKSDRQKALSDAEFKLAAAQQTEVALLNAWVKEQQARSASASKFSVDVLKPQAVQPGAPNDFVVVVNDRRDLWETTGKALVAEVHAVDASDAVIFSQPLNAERTAERRHALRLPASAWEKVKPDAELFLVVAQVDEKTQARTELQERVRLAGPAYATLLTTDKAAYRPGERLFFRSLTLDRISLKPPAREQILKYELFHPDNGPVVNGLSVSGTTDLVRVSAEGRVAPVLAADGKPVRGVGCGEFVLPPELPDGDYTLRLSELQHPGGFAPTVPAAVTRSVKVRSAADNFRKEIRFAHESFAPGEAVAGWAELKFEGKPVAGAAVAGVEAKVDGTPLLGVQCAKATDANGQAKLRFALPPEVLDADVQLRVTFRTPRGDEAVAARVPVVGNRVKVEFFPECGEALVAGVPCKVYVRATTPAGQPVHFRGTVTDGRRTLATVESFNDPDRQGANRGLASFTYTPELGTRVWLKLESPSTAYAPILPGVPVQKAAVALLGGAGAAATRTGFPLPPVRAEGVVMSVLDPVTAPGEPVRVQLHSVGQPRALVVGAYTRGKLSDTQRVNVEPEAPQTLKLMAGTDPRGGVVRITAFEEIDEKQDLKPVAERLVFRKPGEVLNLAVTANGAKLSGAQSYTALAGSEVALGLAATDEKGNPAAAVLWAAAVNSGLAPGAKDRNLPTHFLLAGEVKSPDELEYADFLLTDHPKAAEALDLLLGTQGWRRFAEQQAPPPIPAGVGRQPYYAYAPPQDVTRLMLQTGQYAAWAEPAPVRTLHELSRKFSPRYEAALKAVERAKGDLEEARERAGDAGAVARATSAAGAARHAAEEKAARAEAAREPVRKFQANAWLGVAALAALALGCGLVALRRPAGRLPLGFSTLGSLGLAAFLAVASGWGDEARAGAKGEVAKADQGARGEAPAPQPPGAAPLAEGADPAAEKDARPADKLAATVAPRPEPVPAPATMPVEPPKALPPAAPKGGPGGLERGFPAPDARPESAPALATGAAPKPAAGRGAPNIREYPPLALLQPGRSGPAAFGRPGGPLALGLPSPAPPGMAPHVGRAGMGGFGAAGGVQMASPNGAVVEIDALRALAATARKRSAAASADADELRRAADFAAKFAQERGLTLATPYDGYHHFYGYLHASGRDKAKAGADAVGPKEPKGPEALGGRHAGDLAEPIPPLVVREFAAPRPSAAPLPDADEPDTVLWRPVIVLPADGKAVLHFRAGAAPGGYEVVVAGHTADGRLGSARGLLRISPAPTVNPAAPVVPAVPAAPKPQPAP